MQRLSRRDLVLAAALAPIAAQAQVLPVVTHPGSGHTAPAVPLSANPVPTGAAPLPPGTPEALGLVRQRLVQAMGVLATGVGEGRINGAVFAVARQGRLAWLQAVGFRDSAGTEPLRPDAIFPLASMTKPLASVAAMVLVERGRLRLSDPVSLYLPAFRDARVLAQPADDSPPGEPERARRAITVHDLLRHTAGLTSGALYPDSAVGRLYNEAGVERPTLALADAVDRIAALPLLRQPGTGWDYGVSTDVLARVVEIVAAQPFDQFLAAQVTRPLRMADTTFQLPEKDLRRVAEPRTDPLTGALPLRQDPAAPRPRRGGTTGLLGTAGDYLRFAQALLAGGAIDSARVLGGGTVAHMTVDHLGTLARDTPSGSALLGPGRGFGLGVAVRLAAGVDPLPGSAGDYGWGGFFGTQFLVDPQRDLVAVLLINQRNQAAHYARLFRTLVYQTLAR